MELVPSVIIFIVFAVAIFGIFAFIASKANAPIKKVLHAEGHLQDITEIIVALETTKTRSAKDVLWNGLDSLFSKISITKDNNNSSNDTVRYYGYLTKGTITLNSLKTETVFLIMITGLQSSRQKVTIRIVNAPYTRSYFLFFIPAGPRKYTGATAYGAVLEHLELMLKYVDENCVISYTEQEI